MARPIRRLIRIVLLLLILVVASCALFPTLGAGWVKTRLENDLEERLDADVQVSTLELGWLSGVRAENIRIRRPGAAEEALVIGDLRAQPSLSDLVKGAIVDHSLEIRDVVLRVRRTAEGLDWAHLAKADDRRKSEREEMGSLPRLDLAGKIRNLTLIYEDDAVGAPLSLEGADIDVVVESDRPIRVKATAPAGLKIEASIMALGSTGVLPKPEMSAEGSIEFLDFDVAALGNATPGAFDRLGGRIRGTQTFTWSAARGTHSEGDFTVEQFEAVRNDGATVAVERANLTNSFDDKAKMTIAATARATAVGLAGLHPRLRPLTLKRVEARGRVVVGENVTIEQLELADPSAHLTASGSLALSGASAGRFEVTARGDLERLSRYVDGMPHATGALDSSIVVRTRGPKDVSLEGRTVVTSFEVRDLGEGLAPISEPKIELHHELRRLNDSIEFRNVELQSGLARLRIAGRLDGLEGSKASGRVDYELQGDANRLCAIAGELLDYTATGNLTLEGALIGAGDALDFTLKARGDALGIEGGMLREPLQLGRTIADLEGSFERSSRHLRLGPSEITCDTGRLRIDTTEIGEVTSIRGEFDGDPDRVLSALMDEAPRMGPTRASFALERRGREFAVNALDLESARVAVKGTGRVTLAEPGDDSMAAELSATDLRYRAASGSTLTARKIQARASLPASGSFEIRATGEAIAPVLASGRRLPAGPLDLQIRGTRDAEASRFTVSHGRLAADGIDVTGTGEWEPGGPITTNLTANLDCARFARNWLSLTDPEAAGSGRGSLTVSLALSQLGVDGARAGQGELLARADGISLHGFDLRDLDVAAELRNGLARITKGTARLNDGAATISGTVDFTASEPVTQLVVKGADVRLVEEWQPAIARVVPLFAGVGVKAEGLVDLDCTIKGRGLESETVKRTMNGAGSLGLRNGRISGGPILAAIGGLTGLGTEIAFSDVASRFNIENGGVRQDGLTLESPVVDIRLAGRTGLDGSLDHILGVRPKGAVPGKFRRFANILSKDGFLPLTIRGSVDSPTIAPPSPEDIASGLLGRGLQELLGGKPDETGQKPAIPNPGGLLEGLLGGKPKPKPDSQPSPKQKPKNEQQPPKPPTPQDVLRGLGGLLGGNKPKPNPKPKPKPKPDGGS